jgi:hypothetical protein
MSFEEAKYEVSTCRQLSLDDGCGWSIDADRWVKEVLKTIELAVFLIGD